MRLLTLTFLATAACGQLAAADATPVKQSTSHLTYASKPYEGAWLTTWIEAVKSPRYATATAHEPNFGDRVLWPAVTDEDGVPAYKNSVWPKARLLVWNRRDDEKAGKLVDVMEPANWLQDGKPATEGPDEESDVVFPDSPTPYRVLCSAGDTFERGFAVRHITIGANAGISLFGLECHGNWWVRKGGWIYERHGGAFVGAHNTFARNDNTPAWRPCPNPRPADKTADEWPFTTESSQYFWIKKKGGEVEIVGNISSQDQFHINSGTLVVGPDSYLGTGGRGWLKIDEEGILQLQSGSAVAKLLAQPYTTDIEIKGVLRAGSPSRPIRRDCMLGLSAKDYVGEISGGPGSPGQQGEYRCGLVVKNKNGIVVHQANPQAKLRIQWSGVPLRHLRDQAPAEGDRERAGWLVQRAAAERFSNTITVNLNGELHLQHVRFDDLRLGGLVGTNVSTIRDWTDVTFGDRNQGPVEQVNAPADWWTSLVILPAGPLASLPAGKPTTCEILTCQPECETRYTTDGSEPIVTSPLYKKPFPLTTTTVVQARLFYKGRPQGVIARADYLSTEKSLPGATQPGKAPGLAYLAGADRNGVLSGKPDKSPPLAGVADTVKVLSKGTDFDDNFSMQFTGFISIPQDGVYTLWITCAPHPHSIVRLAGTPICNKGSYQGEVNGNAIALTKGAYPLSITYQRSWWGENNLKLEWEGPGLPRQEIPASAFSH